MTRIKQYDKMVIINIKQLFNNNKMNKLQKTRLLNQLGKVYYYAYKRLENKDDRRDILDEMHAEIQSIKKDIEILLENNRE